METATFPVLEVWRDKIMENIKIKMVWVKFNSKWLKKSESPQLFNSLCKKHMIISMIWKLIWKKIKKKFEIRRKLQVK